MKTVRIVRWRGLEETCTCLPEALDRRDQLDAADIYKMPPRRFHTLSQAEIDLAIQALSQ